MTIVTRSAGVILSAVVAAAAPAHTMAIAPAQAAETLMVSGLNTPTIPDFLMSWVLQGQFANDDMVSVYWPAQAGPYIGLLNMGQSVAVGVPFLEQAIREAIATGEPVNVVGISAGSLVVDEVLRRLADDPTFDPSQLTFMVIGDGGREHTGDGYDPILGYTFAPLPDTPYNTVVVEGEYDGYVDFPDRPWNLLSVANAVVGGVFMHITSAYTDLDTVPAENIKVTYNSVGGKTTSYFIPAQHLPLVQLLPFLAPFEEPLRAIVDAGYSRNDQTAVTSSAASDLTTQTDVETTSTSAGDPPASSLTKPAEETAQSHPSLADKAEAVLNATHGLAEATAEDPGHPDSELANATDRISKAAAKALEQTAKGRATAHKAVPDNVTDLTDGNKVTTRSSSGTKPGARIRAAAEAVQRMFSGNTARTSKKTTGTPTSHTSETGSEAPSSTSSSSGKSGAP